MYVTLADRLVTEKQYGEESDQDLIWPPGYAAFVALSSAMSTPNPAAVALVQLGLTVAIAAMLVVLAGWLAGPDASLLAGWLYALSAAAALWSLTVMSETLFAACLVAAALAWAAALHRRSISFALLCGILLGLAALVRPIGLVLLPIWCVATAVGMARRGHRRLGIRLGMVIAVGAVAVTLPWAVRNQSVHGRLTFSGVASESFYNFNIAQVKASAEGTTRSDAAAWIGAERSELQDTLQVITAYPLAFVTEQVKGVFRTTLGQEAGTWASLLGYPEALRGGLGVVSTFLRSDFAGALSKIREAVSDPVTAQILGLALLAEAHIGALYVLVLALLLFGRDRLGGPLVVGLALTVVVLLVIPAAAGQARFRIPAEPFLAILAALGWTALRSRARSRKPAEPPAIVASGHGRPADAAGET